jgi:hypothetical protein
VNLKLGRSKTAPLPKTATAFLDMISKSGLGTHHVILKEQRHDVG